MSESLVHPDWIDRALAAGDGLRACPTLREVREGHSIVVAHAEVANDHADVIVERSPDGRLRVLWVASHNDTTAGRCHRGWWKDNYPSAKMPKESLGGPPHEAIRILMRDSNVIIPNHRGQMESSVAVLVQQLRDLAEPSERYLPPILAAFLSACTSGLESPVHRQPSDLTALTAPTMPDDLKTAVERYDGWVKEYRAAKDEAERLETVARDAQFAADCARRKADSLGRHAADLQREYAALIVRLAASS